MRPGAALTGLALAALLVPATLGRQEATAPAPRFVDPRTGREAALPQGATLLHVAFFATWCPECLTELDALGDLQDRWSDQGYRLVLVAVRTRHTPERLVQFSDERQPPGMLLFDADGAGERALHVQRVPTHVLFDATGREVARTGELAELVPEIERRLGARGARP